MGYRPLPDILDKVMYGITLFFPGIIFVRTYFRFFVDISSAYKLHRSNSVISLGFHPCWFVNFDLEFLFLEWWVQESFLLGAWAESQADVVPETATSWEVRLATRSSHGPLFSWWYQVSLLLVPSEKQILFLWFSSLRCCSLVGSQESPRPGCCWGCTTS